MFLLTLQSLHFSDIMAAGSLHVLQCTFALSALGINYYQSKYLLLVDYLYYTF